MRAVACFVIGVATTWACGTDGGRQGLLAHPEDPFPRALSDVGLYRDAPAGLASAAAIPYAPAWPLWSDGGDKQRFLVLPEGEVVDDRDRHAWRFPAGTLFFKTFSFTASDTTAPRPIETRVLRATREGWDYGVYLWNDEGDDAVLQDDRPVPVEILTEDGSRVLHEVPGRFECRQCHEVSTSVVLGFNELQLGAPGETAGHSWLRDLHDRGLFAAALPEDPEVIEERDPVLLQVMGAVTGNCTHCHDGSGRPSSSFDLRYPVLVASTVGQPTGSSAGSPGIRVVPGAPDESVLYQAIAGIGTDEVRAMPPLGIAVRDRAFIDRVRQWIEGIAP